MRAAGVCPAGARGYYEVEVLGPLDSPQIGFCAETWVRSSEHRGIGVGDDAESWGVEGDRARKWHQGDAGAFGSFWQTGDVVGLAVDLTDDAGGGGGGGQLWASVNGDFAAPHGLAFTLPRGLQTLHPALVAGTGCVHVNLGQRPFRYAPPGPGFLPLMAWNHE